MTYPLKVKVTKCRANRLVVLTGSIIITVMLEDGYGNGSHVSGIVFKTV